MADGTNSKATTAPVRYQHSGLARRLRYWVNPWLIRRTSTSSPDCGQTLVVAGSPRSGTTWLSELLATLPGAAVLFEPLQSNQVESARRLGFHRGTYLEPGQDAPERQRFMRQALSGQVLDHWTTSRATITQILRRRFWVVKFVLANLLLGWMANRFPIRRPALIVRHPCAVVASQLKMWQAHCWREFEFAEFLEAWPHFQDVIQGLRTPVQWLAACWCIEQFAPLSLPGPASFRLVSYERLVRQGEAELRNLLADWELPMPSAAIDRLRVASTTTQRDSHVLREGDPLGGWRHKLSADQVKQILDVVQQFGLDFYSDALEPDYERMLGPLPLGGGSICPPTARALSGVRS